MTDTLERIASGVASVGLIGAAYLCGKFGYNVLMDSFRTMSEYGFNEKVIEDRLLVVIMGMLTLGAVWGSGYIGKITFGKDKKVK